MFFSVVDLCSDFFLSLSFCSSSTQIYILVCVCLQRNNSICGKGLLKGLGALLLFSPVIYRKIEKFVPSRGTITQYVSDLLIDSDTKEWCKANTLLPFLSSQGHKASLGKLQYCQTEVKYLWHLLSAEGCKLLQSRSQPILPLKLPTINKILDNLETSRAL